MSMAWFITCNYFVTKAEMPKVIFAFSGVLQRLFACWPPTTKNQVSDDKKNNSSIENGEINKSSHRDIIEVIEYIKLISRDSLFIFYTQRQNQADGIEKKEQTIVEDVESVNAKSLNNKLLQKTTDVGANEKNDYKAKSKCNFCNRCPSCQADHDKDKTKTKNNKDIEARCNAINTFLFLFIFLFMLVANVALWVTMAGGE